MAQPGVVDHSLRLPFIIAFAEHACEDSVNRCVAETGVDELEEDYQVFSVVTLAVGTRIDKALHLRSDATEGSG